MAPSKKSYFSGNVKKSVLIHCPKEDAWNKISKIAKLSWVLDVDKTVFLSKKKFGDGAVRKITFNDGNNVIEIIVGWENGRYFSYIATTGLPLRAYHATISLEELKRNLVKVTWQSFFNSKEMSKKEFLEFENFMNLFYKNSLSNLKSLIES